MAHLCSAARCLFIIVALTTTSFAGDIAADLSTLANGLLAQVKVDAKSTLAVLPFNCQIRGQEKAGRAVAEYLVTILAQSPQFALVDRLQLNKALQEIALSQSGVIADGKAVEVGKMVAAQYILSGTITEALGRQMVFAQIVQTETSTIVASVSQPMESGALVGFTQELLGEKGQASAAIFRSVVVPGWGQFYTNHPVRGSLCLGGFLIGAGATATCFVLAANRAEDVNQFSSDEISNEKKLIEQCFGSGVTAIPLGQQTTFNDWKNARRNELDEAYTSQMQTSFIVLGVTGVVYLVNLIDAGIAGHQSRKKFQLYFSATPHDVGAALSCSF